MALSLDGMKPNPSIDLKAVLDGPKEDQHEVMIVELEGKGFHFAGEVMMGIRMGKMILYPR